MKPLLRRARACASVAVLGLAMLPGLVLAQDSLDAPYLAVQTPAALAPVAPVSPAAAASADVPWYQHLNAAAQAYGVDVHLLQAVAKVESNFDPLAISRAGAIGLMQIMPVTAFSVAGLRGNRKSMRQQLQDPATNVHAGALYLRNLMDVFSERLDLVLAAYNAGVGNVRKAGNRVPPNGETPRFVKKVSELYANLKAAAGVAEAPEGMPVAAEEPTAAATALPSAQ